VEGPFHVLVIKNSQNPLLSNSGIFSTPKMSDNLSENVWHAFAGVLILLVGKPNGDVKSTWHSRAALSGEFRPKWLLTASKNTGYGSVDQVK